MLSHEDLPLDVFNDVEDLLAFYSELLFKDPR